MRLKLLLLFLFAVYCSAQTSAQKGPYKSLLITEASMSWRPSNYVEITNMGEDTVNLSEFEFGNIAEWSRPWQASSTHFMLPKKKLAPGKSFVMATAADFEPENWVKDPLHNQQRITNPEFYKLADMLLHYPEDRTNENDSITPGWSVLDGFDGGRCFYLRHFFINEEGKKDSLVIDQVGGIFDQADGTNIVTGYDVAGVRLATANNTLIRKTAVKTGNMDFNSGKGLDYSDSEWIPIPKQGGWSVLFWTVGNQVNAELDANTLVPKTEKVKVDLDNATISVPWGIRRGDSLMCQFEKKPGLAWKYDCSPVPGDSAFNSIHTGDQLTLIVCGNEVTVKKFSLIVQEPTSDDNIVIQKNGFNYNNMTYTLSAYSSLRVTNGIKGMDTISSIDYATRVDTLYKYLEKAPKASWKIIPKDGVARPDLKNGDILRVTSEKGISKDYFLKVEKNIESPNANLASITWPDIPAFFKGSIAESFGWTGDTILGFTPSRNDYVVRVPFEFEGIPALTYTKQHTDSKVVVTRAKTINGTSPDRTVTFTVTAEDDSTTNVYTVRFEKEKNPENVQPYLGEPFFSQYVFFEQWGNYYLEIANPSTEPLDLSDYMIVGGWSNAVESFKLGTAINAWGDAYYRYVPGKKWQGQADWQVQPCILEPDMATNAIVYPGDVFVIADVRIKTNNDKNHGNGDTEYRKEIDIDFNKNPWGRSVAANNAIAHWKNGSIFMFKILNDSVKNGLKSATDYDDFELIESWGPAGTGGELKIGGIPENMIQSNFRKPAIYKPNPEPMGSAGTTPQNTEWFFTDQNYYVKLKYPWPDQILRVCDGIGSHNMDEVTISKSTVSSKVYKVTEGYSLKEVIKGLTTGTTVTNFFSNILKSNELQALTVKSAVNGNVLAEADAISKGDTLIVLSADKINTSKYILDVTAEGFSSNALLTSNQYTIDVTGSTGKIAGISKGTLLKEVLTNVSVPVGATYTIIDENDAYMSFSKVNYDSTYVNVLATDKIYFEVVAENGINKVLYQLMPDANVKDAYVTSDVYSVDQFASLIQFIPIGTSVHSLLSNVYPAPGATITVFDKGGFERVDGDIYRDDKLVVTSADGTTRKAYYFSMLNFYANKYFAFVVSDDYQINQVNYVIAGASLSTSVAEFKDKLYPSFGATLKVMAANGTERTSGNLTTGDYLLVTAADENTTNTYKMEGVTGKVDMGNTVNIKMYPNPTADGRLVVQGLAKGNRLQVFNAAGIQLRDVTVDNSTDYVNLASQPAGIYIFVVSAGDKHISIQKIVKR